MARYCLACPALGATLETTDAALASRWLVDVMAACPLWQTVDVLIDGVNRGSRVAARLMTVSEASVERAILAETAIVRATPATLFPLKAA